MVLVAAPTGVPVNATVLTAPFPIGPVLNALMLDALMSDVLAPHEERTDLVVPRPIETGLAAATADLLVDQPSPRSQAAARARRSPSRRTRRIGGEARRPLRIGATVPPRSAKPWFLADRAAIRAVSDLAGQRSRRSDEMSATVLPMRSTMPKPNYPAARLLVLGPTTTDVGPAHPLRVTGAGRA